MATNPFNALATQFTSSVDASVDSIPFWQGSTNQAFWINRNTYLNLTSQPVGISDSLTLSNKTLGNTNSITVKDGSFTLQNTSDITKIAVFSLASITAGNTRTYTLPDASTTVVGTGTTQTLTNKTLTSPAITGGTLDNATVTVDTVAGHTTSNTGTVYGMSVTTGVIASAALAGAVNTAALATNAVGAANIATNAINLAYVAITASVTMPTPTTDTLVTGLTTGSITIPAGGRKVKITAWVNSLANSGTNAATSLSIWDGTVGIGSELAAAFNTSGTVDGDSHQLTVMAIVTPAAGSKTYNVGTKATSGNSVVGTTVGSTPCGFILVELT